MAPSSEHSSALTCPLLCCCLLTTLLARCFWVSFIARPLWDHSYVPPHLLARIEARACHLYVTAAMLLYGADDALERISHLDAALEGDYTHLTVIRNAFTRNAEVVAEFHNEDHPFHTLHMKEEWASWGHLHLFEYDPKKMDAQRRILNHRGIWDAREHLPPPPSWHVLPATDPGTPPPKAYNVCLDDRVSFVDLEAEESDDGSGDENAQEEDKEEAKPDGFCSFLDHDDEESQMMSSPLVSPERQIKRAKAAVVVEDEDEDEGEEEEEEREEQEVKWVVLRY
ncbi:hypothetical protein EV122DRAFT_256766 [Schizophyllum commune]|nr:hypothetical protein K525DRAFT_245475 [Schizophyllum commune Loenen D]